MSGYITFQLGGSEFACRTEDVREVVRLAALQVLPGLPTGVSGLLELRGTPLPVVDVRVSGAPGSRGDVLVLADDVEHVGVVVDRVTGVHDENALVSDGDGEHPKGLPDYVVAVLRRQASSDPVLLVELRQLGTFAAA